MSNVRIIFVTESGDPPLALDPAAITVSPEGIVVDFGGEDYSVFETRRATDAHGTHVEVVLASKQEAADADDVSVTINEMEGR